jgi:hypothetical protein
MLLLLLSSSLMKQVQRQNLLARNMLESRQREGVILSTTEMPRIVVL